VELRGCFLGYKLYKYLIDKYGFITSAIGLSDDAKNIWYKLMLDNELYCFSSNVISGVISKDKDNIFIKECLDRLKKYDLIFDDELKEKIKEIYGTLELYKQ